MNNRLAYFDRKNELTVSNDRYKKQIEMLFEYLLDSDDYKNDNSSKLFFDINPSHPVKATIIAKQDGILCGVEEVNYFFSNRGLIIEFNKNDSQSIKKNESICTISGDIQTVLKYERTILNILQRASGIATQTAKLQSSISGKARIAATRKTLWGWFDKKAVACGGGLTHRLSLSDGILIKDNHLNSLSQNRITALQDTLNILIKKQVNQPVEIEVETVGEVKFISQSITSNKSLNQIIIMLDNFSLEKAREAIAICKKTEMIIELSGGINEKNLSDFAALGADVISLGALTHSAHALDMSLEVN